MLFLEQVSGIFRPWKSTWPRSHSLVTLLLIYYVTRKRCLPLPDDALGTIATLAVVVFGASLQISVSRFFTFSCWCNFLSYISVSICGFGKNGHHLPQGRHSVFLRSGHDLRSLPSTRKSCVGDVPRCFFGSSSSALLVFHRRAPW